MIEKGQLLEDAFFDTPDKGPAAPVENEKLNSREEIIKSVRAAVKAALKQGSDMDGSTVLELYANMMRKSDQQRVTGYVASAMKKRDDFGTSEMRKRYKIAEKTMPTVMKKLIETAAKLGIKTLKTTGSKGKGRHKRYYMFKPPDKPLSITEQTNNKINKRPTSVFGRITRNLEFIPNRYHEIALYLALSSKSANWVTYNDITEATGFKQDTVLIHLRALEKILPKIGVKLMIKQSKVQRKKFMGVALKNNNNKMKSKFKAIEIKRSEHNQRKKSKAKKAKTPLIVHSSAEIIITNWDKRKPLDEWDDDPIQPPDLDD